MSYNIALSDFIHFIDQDVIITEGKSWTEKGLKCRIDPPNGYSGQQRHIHVGKFVWNQDGSRSHEGRWVNSEPAKRAQQMAAKGLGIDIEMLESCMDWMVIVEPEEELQQILESMNEFTEISVGI